jgi:hypothetical protein
MNIKLDFSKKKCLSLNDLPPPHNMTWFVQGLMEDG